MVSGFSSEASISFVTLEDLRLLSTRYFVDSEIED